MMGPKVSSKDGSVAIGSDNNAPVVNVNARDGSTVNVHIERQAARELPSVLGSVIVHFSTQSLVEYGLGDRRAFPPEVTEKIKYNNLPPNHRVLVDYRRFGLVLEKSYHGVEQQNADARYLVRRKAAIAYDAEVAMACAQSSVPDSQRSVFARSNARALVDAVVTRLLHDYKCSKSAIVAEEIAHLAISLVVADAVVECEVLERPTDATAA